MANVLEVRMTEMQKELEMCRREHAEDVAAIAKCRAEIRALEERNRRLEASIVAIVLENYAEGR